MLSEPPGPDLPSARRVELPGRYGPIAALQARHSAEPAATVLLLPGYTGSKEDFAPMLAPLALAGLEAVAIDLPGQYESPGPEVEHEYLPSILGASVVELVEKLVGEGRPVLLLGHSFGGLVARGAVLGGAPIHGLTLLDSGPSELPGGERRRALEGALVVLREQGAVAAWRLREAFNRRSPDWHEMPQQARDFRRTVFLRSSPVGLLGMARALLAEPDLVDALDQELVHRAIPCAVACGVADDAWPVADQRTMARRLGASFLAVPDARHSPNRENPQALLEAVMPLWRRWA